MDLGILLQPAYYFNSAPELGKTEAWFYLSLYIFLTIIMVFLWFYLTNKAKIQKPYSFFEEKYFIFLITCIAMAFVLIFFRWQEIPYLASRWLIIILTIVTLIKIISLMRHIIKVLPQELANFYNDEKYQKYIPKPKKHNVTKKRNQQ